jgi:hypothetical protein
MVADSDLSRRWFISNGTYPKSHPLAAEPIDGVYYCSEVEAKLAKQNLLECFCGLLAPEGLIIAYVDIFPSEDGPKPHEFFLGEG